MAEWLQSGRLVEGILALTVIEWLALIAYHRRTGRGLGFLDLTPNLLAGMCLLFALREALVGDGWPLLALSLAGALAAHLADLWRRWVR